MGVPNLDGSSSPLNLSFLKLEDSPASSFDPIKEWLLDSDQQNLRPMFPACSDPSLIDSGVTQLPPVTERCDPVDELLGEAMPPTTECHSEVGNSSVSSEEKAGGADVLETGCEGDSAKKSEVLTVKTESLGEEKSAKKSEDLTVKTESLGEGESAKKSEILTLKTESLGEEKSAKKSEDLTVTMESLGDGGCQQESTDSEVDGDTESDGATSKTESASSSSSEEEEEDEDESGDDEDSDSEEERRDEVVEEEEGEIKKSESEELILSSDDELGGGAKGPIKSKNELNNLPPVPPVDVVLHPYHQTVPVGVVSSIIGSQIIVDGLVKHSPLNEGSILWITETRSPLGLVDEIFGPVKNPYYIVRYNYVNEVPVGIHEGTAVSFVAEFSNLILNQNDLHKKGYDASGENDEEIGAEVEFSDDEKEAEYKRSLGQPKRGMANQKNFNHDSFNTKKNKFTSGGSQKDMQRKPPPTEAAGTGKPAPCISSQYRLPSISGVVEANRTSSGFAHSFGSPPPTVSGLANQRNFNHDSSNTKKNWFTSGGFQKDMQHKPPPIEAGTGRPAPCISFQCSLPSISGVVEANGTSSGLAHSFGNPPSTVSAIPQLVQSDGFFGGRPPIIMQQQPYVPWMPRVPVQQQNIGLPGGFVANAYFQHQRQLQQTQPQFLQQQQFFSGLPTGLSDGFPFQQQTASYQELSFNYASLNGQLNSSITPMPMGPLGLTNFGQPPFVCNNINTDRRAPVLNNSGQFFGQLGSTALPGNVHPPMQFNMGASSNCDGGGHPLNARRPFGKRGHL